eukprot:483654_1
MSELDLPTEILERRANQALDALVSVFKNKFYETKDQPNKQKGMKELYDLHSSMKRSIEIAKDPTDAYKQNNLINSTETRKITSLCIHNKSKFKTAKGLASFILYRIQPKRFLQDLDLVQFLNCQGFSSFCIQCVMELVIQSNRLKNIVDLMLLISNNNITITYTYLSIFIIKLLAHILTQHKIIQIFCNNAEYVRITLQFFKHMLSRKAILYYAQIMKPSIGNDTQKCYLLFSGPLRVFFASFGKHQFKIVSKMKMLQYLCHCICSNTFCKKHITIDYNKLHGITKYDLPNTFFVREFMTLFKTYEVKYPNLIKERTKLNVLSTLRNWSAQTKILADLMDHNKEKQLERVNDMNEFCKRKKFNLRYDINTFTQQQLYSLNLSRKSMRSSTTICFNCGCNKYRQTIAHVESNWKVKICKGCRIASYCGKKCQKRDWKFGHKNQCQWFQKHPFCE